MRKGGKVLKRNGKEYDRLADHVGLIPAVIVSPADGVLISDAADERRRYLNACISQLDKGYLHALMRYNAVLAERNRLLKMQLDETMLAIYDRQLVDHAQSFTSGAVHSSNGCNPWSNHSIAPSRATANRSPCTTNRN